MALGMLGAILMALIVMFVVGNLWFHLVESVLEWFRRRLSRRKGSAAWHPLPTEVEDSDDV